MYAVVRTGGKQYKVREGQTLEVERLEVEPGETVELTEVLLIGDGENIVGTPTIPGAKVVAESLGEHKGKKVIVFKYKPKVRYRRKLGHRQTHTTLQIKEIVVPTTAEATTTR